jgi:hypothetical protein
MGLRLPSTLISGNFDTSLAFKAEDRPAPKSDKLVQSPAEGEDSSQPTEITRVLDMFR